MRKKWLLISLVVLVLGVISFSAYEGFRVLRSLNPTHEIKLGVSGKKTLVVNINGAIDDPLAKEIVAALKKYEDDDLVRALVVRIDSPGGTVASSQEMYSEILKFKRKDRKVVASIGDMGASGGYYVACAADRIMAEPGSIVGSIGVIAGFPNIEGLSKKFGVSFDVIKSGEFKDAGSMWRSLTKREKEIFQATVDDIFQQFVGAVVDGRGPAMKPWLSRAHGIPVRDITREMVRARVLELATGRIFSGKEGFEAGLIDALGGQEDAIETAARLAGIEGEPTVIRVKRKISLFDILENKSSAPELRKNLRFFIEYSLP